MSNEKKYFKVTQPNNPHTNDEFYLLWHRRWFKLENYKVPKDETTSSVGKRFVYIDSIYTAMDLEKMLMQGENKGGYQSMREMCRLQALIDGEDYITKVKVGGKIFVEFKEDDDFERLDGRHTKEMAE